MSLFGYWVDDEAATKVIPFCRTLVCLAAVSKDGGLRLFVSDELLPSVIKHLDDRLPCAIRHLICKLNSSTSDNVNQDLTILCQELYNYLSSNFYSRSQVTNDLIKIKLITIRRARRVHYQHILYNLLQIILLVCKLH